MDEKISSHYPDYLNPNQLIGRVGRVFANGPEDRGSIPGRITPKKFLMVLDASLTLSNIRYLSRVK